jgi:predicted DNA-binding protein
MTKQPLTRINYNVPMDLYERLFSTSEREDRPLTTIVVRALEAYISQSERTGPQSVCLQSGSMPRRHS